MLDHKYVDSGRYRGLVKLCGGMRWPSGLLCAPRGDGHEHAAYTSTRMVHEHAAYSRGHLLQHRSTKRLVSVY
jgi:hypothetical protein